RYSRPRDDGGFSEGMNDALAGVTLLLAGQDACLFSNTALIRFLLQRSDHIMTKVKPFLSDRG
ncbi:MAG: hypothetical protein KJO58_00025, partial [Gammaproteobacteria bacterium]|nr:hypothetical protein [Gammaproteobacteria bacterium]